MQFMSSLMTSVSGWCSCAVLPLALQELNTQYFAIFDLQQASLPGVGS